LATPTALLVGTGRGAQLGLLIRGPEILESTRRVDTIVLDKTGTVTTGTMGVVEVVAAGGWDEVDVLRLAGAVEQASEHPIGAAIAQAATSRCGELPSVDDFASTAGVGVQGVVEGRSVAVGRGGDAGALTAPAADAAAHGRTVVVVEVDGAVAGLVVVADSVKPTSEEAVRTFRALGLRPYLLTGDNEATARNVADAVGIAPDDVRAGVMPSGKLEVVADLQAGGRVVAMVGDGVNDAAALAQADLGIAMSGGTDAAIEASDLTIVGDDLRRAGDAIRLSRRTLTTIKGNLFWAFAYNVAAIPLAMSGRLSPVIAAAAMACSSVFVVTNSLRLRRFH
jgi:Cu+-exporting ATPase